MGDIQNISTSSSSKSIFDLLGRLRHNPSLLHRERPPRSKMACSKLHKLKKANEYGNCSKKAYHSSANLHDCFLYHWTILKWSVSHGEPYVRVGFPSFRWRKFPSDQRSNPWVIFPMDCGPNSNFGWLNSLISWISSIIHSIYEICFRILVRWIHIYTHWWLGFYPVCLLMACSFLVMWISPEKKHVMASGKNMVQPSTFSLYKSKKDMIFWSSNIFGPEFKGHILVENQHSW